MADIKMLFYYISQPLKGMDKHQNDILYILINRKHSIHAVFITRHKNTEIQIYITHISVILCDAELIYSLGTSQCDFPGLHWHYRKL